MGVMHKHWFLGKYIKDDGFAVRAKVSRLALRECPNPMTWQQPSEHAIAAAIS